MPNNNDNYEYMKFLDLSGAQQIWNTCKQTFVQTVNGVGIDANGNCQVATGTPLDAYPVGAIYLTTDNSTSPASLFGGTWEQIKDRFLLGAGDTYSNGATGGEATHQLTPSELPQHRHQLYISGTGGNAYGDKFNISTVANGTFGNYGTTRWMNFADTMISRDNYNPITTDQPHNNMPPYLVVYMWKRIA